GAGRGGERVEEGVALVIDLVAAVATERLADDLAVHRQRVTVPVLSEVVEETRRSHDVGEDKRHGAGRLSHRRHAATMTSHRDTDGGRHDASFLLEHVVDSTTTNGPNWASFKPSPSPERLTRPARRRS